LVGRSGSFCGFGSGGVGFLYKYSQIVTFYHNHFKTPSPLKAVLGSCTRVAWVTENKKSLVLL
jgi:hypothetical protein